MAHPQTTPEWLHPRQGTRILVGAAVPSAMALGLIVDKWLWPPVLSWLQAPGLALAEQEARVGIIVAGLLGVIVLPGITVSLWFWLVALRIHRGGVFPPRGYPIVVATAVVRGSAANRQLFQHVLLGIFSAGVCVYIVWAIFTIFPIAKALRAIGG